MAWDSRDPLKRYIRNQRVVDAQLRKVLLLASNDAKRRVLQLSGQEGVGSRIRSAQLELTQRQLRMWAEIGNVIEDGIHLNAQAVADVNELFTDDLIRSLGVRPSASFRRSMLAQANNTIKTYLARQNLGMTLSERVYKNGQVASGRIDRIVSNGILRGASAREIARDVSKFINPNTPGGTSYAAMRLARTELNNSFHQSANEAYSANPFINKVSWNLSGSHPKPDECDALVGKYDPADVPDKPHPQCLCFVTPEVMGRRELVRRFKRGEFDEWADGQMTA